MLGITGARVWWREDLIRSLDTKKPVGLGWRRIRRTPGPDIFATGITGVTPKGHRIGSHGVAVGGLTQVGFVELDIDVHDVALLVHERIRRERPYAWLELTKKQRQAYEARVRREILGERIAAVVDAFRREYPDVCPLVTRTPNGGHLTVILDRLVAPELAYALGESILDRIEVPGVKIEVFPKPSGRTARLPLTRSRLVDIHGRNMHARRAQDARWLLDHGRDLLTPLRALDVTLRDLKRWVKAAERAVSPRGETESVDSSETARTGDGQRFGSEFARTVAGYLEHGIPNDESWLAVGRIAFASRIGLDLERAQCRALFDHVIDRTADDGSTRAKAYAGLELRISYECALDYYERGIVSGKLSPGKLADPELRRLAGDVLGIDLSRPEPRPAEDLEAKRAEVSAKRSEAARRRWAYARGELVRMPRRNESVFERIGRHAGISAA